MPHQNRVTPFGEIVALPGRGLLMGNRGVLHDENKRIVRQYQSRRWIACRLEYKGVRRRIMQPRRYTELFFLDEAAALSAGHRPCAECRRDDYKRFTNLWAQAHGGPSGADAMDAVIHADRMLHGAKRTWRAQLRALPNGSYVAIDDEAWLLWQGQLLAWSDAGYTGRGSARVPDLVDVLTPQCIVSVIRAGYTPDVHPSALLPQPRSKPNDVAQ